MSDELRREQIEQRLTAIRNDLPESVTLIVVTKNFPVTDIEILYQLGERNFGENRVQELISKREVLAPEVDGAITWHYQGTIQSNKTALLNRYADVIHSVDSMRVVDRLDPAKQVFLQINLDPTESSPHIASNRLRSGIDPEEIDGYLEAMAAKFAGNFCGVMGVAPHFDGITSVDIGRAFARLQVISSYVTKVAPEAKGISAGMSDDFQVALAHGATHIRLGSSILGQREPTT